jgi:DNA-binding CsgD family transcriptional regulator
MDRNEAIKKLATLSQRERQVLGLVCAGTPYKVIAKTLFIEIPTVKAVMGRVYVKLGLDQLAPAERRKAIYQVYGPLLDSSALPSEPMPPEKDEPVSMAIIKMVDEDEIEIIPPTKSEVIYIPEPVKPDGRRPIMMIIVGALSVVCLLVVIVLLRGRSTPAEIPTQGNPQNVVATEAIMLENTATSVPTSVQVLPTEAPIIQENTAVPTTPPEPTTAQLPTAVVPSISLPFSDSFDNGTNPAWEILSGSWLTADGRYTISNADQKWAFSVLDDPSWTNYRIKVNVKLESSKEGGIAIVVRYGANKYLAFHVVNLFSKGGWAFYDGHSFTDISGYGSITNPDQFDLEVDAIGNEFIAKINGMETQRISLSGYDKGGVGLGISCFYPACSSFSDFQVRPAP